MVTGFVKLTQSCLLTAAAAAALNAVPAFVVAQTLPIEDFVRRVHIHGLPYAEATRYPSTSIPVLLAMLEDRSNLPYWTNVVGVLGMIGDDSVAARLITFAESGSGSIPAAEYRAKASVSMALGYLVNRTGSRLALDYLSARVDPASWNARGIEWTSPLFSDSDQRNRRLSSVVLLGLALSGTQEARALLTGLSSGQTGLAGAPAAQAAALRSSAADALRELDLVSQLGLARYDQRRGHP